MFPPRPPRARHAFVSRLGWPHTLPLLALTGLALFYWGRVLFTTQVLLPGEFLRGFAPFGNDPQAAWNILQWDALGQYYPWRSFAARELRAGHVPLWNPHQFAGTPFLANGQSAVFYPLSLPFWTMDVARAFGVSALLHTLLASFGTYFLAWRWGLSRAAALLSAIAFAWCGYLTAWVTLPTLSNTASWLPLLVLLFEHSVGRDATAQQGNGAEATRLGAAANDSAVTSPVAVSPLRFLALSFSLCCALLAGHAQVFFYCLLALGLRALTFPHRVRAMGVLFGALLLALALGALQLLPTLELARLGHRAAQGGASAAGWEAVRSRALQWANLPSLLVPQWPLTWGSLDENFGYIGVSVALLAALILAAGIRRILSRRTFDWRRAAASPFTFAIALTGFGLAYALATPLAQGFYFGVPGLAQMGGVGRALLLLSLGAALLAGYALDALRARLSSPVVPVVALLLVCAELFAASWNTQPTAPRAAIYPRTKTTDFLQNATRDGSRVLFVTPRAGWQPPEFLQPARNHPPGVLPPNGAMVYGLHDVSGYDSLALRAYREWAAARETFAPPHDPGIAPQWNGNMMLVGSASGALDALNVRYVVSSETLPMAGRLVLQTEGCFIYQRVVRDGPRVSGRDFAPGRRQGKYQPQSFRLGVFISLCGLALMSFTLARHVTTRAQH